MFRLLLLLLGLSLLLPAFDGDADAVAAPLTTTGAAGLSQLIHRPHGGNYKRRRTARKAARKARKNDKKVAARKGEKYEKPKSLKARKREERRLAKRRKGVITIDAPIRNN